MILRGSKSVTGTKSENEISFPDVRIWDAIVPHVGHKSLDSTSPLLKVSAPKTLSADDEQTRLT